MENNWRKEVKDLLKNKTMADVKSMSVGMDKNIDMDNVDGLFNHLVGKADNLQDLLYGEEVRPQLTLMGKLKRDEAQRMANAQGVPLEENAEWYNSELADFQKEVKMYCNSKNYKTAQKDMQLAQETFNVLQGLIEAQKKQERELYNKLQFDHMQLWNFMSAIEKKDLDQQLNAMKAIVEMGEDSIKVKEYKQKMQVEQRKYALAKAKVTDVESRYANEIAEIRKEELKGKIERGEI